MELPSEVEHALPYALTFVGLVGGLVVFKANAFPAPVTYLIGGLFLLVGLGSITYMIAAHSGPGERPPDF